MNTRDQILQGARHELQQATAQDLMTSSPRSIHESTTVKQAAEFLSLMGIGGAPVIDDAGRPVGVLSRTDVQRHLGRIPEALSDLASLSEEGGARASIPVCQIMTRAVFSVRPETPATKVIAKLMALQVRRLFVVDPYGVLIGVVSASDLLRPLVAPEATSQDEDVASLVDAAPQALAS